MNGSPLDAGLLGRVSDYQRLGADPGASAWVSASAGSGKTRVLRDRVLRLLLAGVRPERILCLTFTKAAAAEMARRINAELGDWATLDTPGLEVRLHGLLGRAPDAEERRRSRRLFAAVLDAPGGARIMTIHAFCQSVLGRFPLEAGIAPHFQVMEDRDSDEMLAFVRDDVLSVDPADQPALAAALSRMAVQVHEVNFPALLRQITSERAKIAEMIGRSGGLDGAVVRLAKLLGTPVGREPADIVSDACADGAYDDAGLRTLAAALSEGTGPEQGRAVAISAWLVLDPAGRAAGFNDYARVFLTQQGTPRKTIANKKTMTAHPRIEDLIDRECARLVSVSEACRKAELLLAGTALYTVAQALLERYAARKRAGALLDYDDLIDLTRSLLRADGRAAWVLFKLDGGVDHILIDEAQDTSPRQWDVVLALVGEFFSGYGPRDEENEARGLPPRSVFAVGDPKQSIYSFQGAAPERFAEIREMLSRQAAEAERAWHDVPLNFSFRSAPDVLHAVDSVFAQPSAGPGVVAEDGSPLQHIPLRAGMAGRVELWPLAEPEMPGEQEPWKPPVERLAARGANEILAGVIAERIRHWLRHGERLEGQGRPMEPGDIMVLVRRRGGFVDALVRALKERDVPVAGVDRMVLGDQIAVMDLLALGRFLLLPEDDLTLATLLKSPLLGLDENQLFALAHGRGEDSLWRMLDLRSGVDPAFGAARDWLEDLLARVDFERPYELFAGVLARGGREALFRRLGPDAADPIDEFLSLALAYERQHAPSLQGFLHWMAAGEAEVKRDLDQTRGAVRVMTVHGAKGLEAPIVILPDTTRPPALRENLFWGADTAGRLLVWLPRAAEADDTAGDLREAARRAQEDEYRRLLYVAMTRAEERLIVCGAGEAKDGSWYDLVRSALESIAEMVPDPDLKSAGLALDVVYRLSSAQTAQLAKGEPAAGLPAFQPLPAWARTPAPDEPDPPRPLAPSRLAEDPPARSPLEVEDDLSRFRRGTILHHLLQWLPALPAEERPAAAARYLGRAALDLTADRQTALWEEARAVLDAPDFAALFGPASLAEVSVTGLVRDAQGRPQAVSGQIDRLVVTDTSVLIVDYKSNRPPPAAPEGVPEVYLHQMAHYRALLRATWPDRKVTACLLWTDGPRLMPLPDHLLDAHAPAGSVASVLPSP